VASQSELVSVAANGTHVEFGVIGDGSQVDQDEQFEESGIFSLLWDLEEVDNASVLLDVVQGPVVVLSASVDVLEWLFMEKNLISSP
jgi:hypothetical protein